MRENANKNRVTSAISFPPNGRNQWSRVQSQFWASLLALALAAIKFWILAILGSKQRASSYYHAAHLKVFYLGV